MSTMFLWIDAGSPVPSEASILQILQAVMHEDGMA